MPCRWRSELFKRIIGQVYLFLILSKFGFGRLERICAIFRLFPDSEISGVKEPSLNPAMLLPLQLLDIRFVLRYRAAHRQQFGFEILEFAQFGFVFLPRLDEPTIRPGLAGEFGFVLEPLELSVEMFARPEKLLLRLPKLLQVCFYLRGGFLAEGVGQCSPNRLREFRDRFANKGNFF